MGRVEKEIVVNASPDRVFYALVEPSERAAWSTSFEEQPVAGGIRVGARIAARRRASTSGSRYELVVKALEPGKRLVLDVLRNGRHGGSASFELEPMGAATRVRNVGEFDLPLLQRVMEPVVAAALAKDMDAELAALKRHVESSARPNLT